MSESRERKLHTARVASLVASAAIALAAGTNYVYSAYAPQLSERLNLSATETNLIGTFGNLGMYLSGIPSGLLVDNKGPRPPLLIGAACLFIGYYPVHLAMVAGEGYLGVPALCFFSMLTGIGSCCSFGGALKMAALNWPAHRGTATAIPLAAFGLSAFVFSTLSSWFFPGNTGSFLLALAVATSGIILVSFVFCRIVPVPGSYGPVPTADPDSSRLHRTKPGESLHSGRYDELGTSTGAAQVRKPSPPPTSSVVPNLEPNPDENSSLFSKSSDEEDVGNIRDSRNFEDDSGAVLDGCSDQVHRVDIRGWALFRSTDFWLLWTVLGTLTGVGLMTINNIGHNAQVLWSEFDPEKPPEFVQRRQGLNVSILSICSFSGRMISGISSDVLIKSRGIERLWLIITSSSIFFLGQIAAIAITNPYDLWLVSTLNGLAYGMLFGVFPTIVSEAFGVHGLSTNWGAMTIAAVISGNTLNLFYGKVFDDHSTIVDGRRECSLGRDCYRNAYWISLVVVFLGFGTTVVAMVRNRALAGKS